MAAKRYRDAMARLERAQTEEDEAKERVADIGKVEAELKRLNKKIDEFEETYYPLSAYVEPPRNLLGTLNRKIDAMKKKLKELDAENAALRKQLSDREE